MGLTQAVTDTLPNSLIHARIKQATYRASVKAYKLNARAPVCPAPPPLFTHAYVTQYNANDIKLCTLAADGTMTGCVDSGATGLQKPAAIALHGGYAFITNNGFNNGYVSVCTQDPETKLLSACNTAANLNQLLGIAITENGKWAYLSPYTGQVNVPVKRCAVSGTPPTLSSCSAVVSQRK